MTPPRFSLPWSNPDLDIHPDPKPGWHRVAVIGLWLDPKVLRRDWPDAAVVGPLRTLRGIDLLVRSLLANPQIRVVVVVGRDLSPGESVRKALTAHWSGELTHARVLDADGTDAGWDVLTSVKLLGLSDDDPGAALASSLQAGGRYALIALNTAAVNGWATDRPGGAIFLPPPSPPENPELPAGLPGQRITGQTLSDVWPKVLHEVLRFGDNTPTSYGESRELLNLVSVIKDPEAWYVYQPEGKGPPVRLGLRTALSTLIREGGTWHAPVGPAGLSLADLDSYYNKSFMGAKAPDGVSYTYGSRMNGSLAFEEAAANAHARRMARQSSMPVSLPFTCKVNQIANVRNLLQNAPDTRAAWLTPWRPDEDAGKEEGRPCFVGAWFRAVGGKLNLTVIFRSHCLFSAYPLNLAAVCRWLCEEAAALGMEVGVVTCVSMSAHIYGRDLEAASKVVSAQVKPGAWSQDHRSAWRVWRDEVGPVYHAEAIDPGGTRVLQLFAAPTKERLVRDIQASGLVTSVQHALWLGAEVGRL